MAKRIQAASAVILAAALTATPALAQTTVVVTRPPVQTQATPAPTMVTPAPTVVAPAPTVATPAPTAPAPTAVTPVAPAAVPPATPSVVVPQRAMPYPVQPGTVVRQGGLVPVARAPSHAPVTAQPGGPSPASPSEYATGTPMTVTGRIDGVANRGGVTSFRLQTRTEAWTVVVPQGQAGAIASGRTATVVGYPHVEIRNQLLAQSVTAGR